MLIDLGLPSTLISLIMFCLTSTEIHILWNGEKTEFFKPSLNSLSLPGDFAKVTPLKTIFVRSLFTEVITYD